MKCYLSRSGTYNLFKHNCNNFSEEVSNFLVGKGIPKYILDLPEEILRTWVSDRRPRGGLDIFPFIWVRKKQGVRFSPQTIGTAAGTVDKQSGQRRERRFHGWSEIRRGEDPARGVAWVPVTEHSDRGGPIEFDSVRGEAKRPERETRQEGEKEEEKEEGKARQR